MIDAQAQTIIEKLDMLIRLTGLQITQPLDNVTQAILLLDRAGIDRQTIAEICNTTPNTVSVRLSEAKKKNKTVTKKEVSENGSFEASEIK